MSILSHLKANWKSGITVSLVSIPLSVSLAVASQTTPLAGIITAIWAGLMASIFGGSNFNIVGPTGALSGLLATYAISQGAGALPSLALVSGLFILIAYLLKLEKYLVFVPANTIHGFTLGVAFIISLNQLNSALGITGLKAHERLIENLKESFENLNRIDPFTVIVFLIFLTLLIFWPKINKSIPGAIVLAPIGIVLGYLSTIQKLPFTLQTLGMRFTNINPEFYSSWEFKFSPQLITTAIVVAFVAILETMISAKIADGMTKTKHDKRKEMLGLGIANLASGIMGGIPATAALARTSLNIKSGATNKISATISSISILLISFVFLAYFKFIPMAVIAAILVNVAIRMIETEHFNKMYKHDKKSFILSMLVAFITVYEDPTVGILFGVAISLIIFVEKLSKGQYELIVNDINKKIADQVEGEGAHTHNLKANADTLVYSFKGQLAYVNGQAHISRFERGFSKEYKNIILRFRGVYFIDLDGIEVLEEILTHLKAEDKQILISGVSPVIEPLLETSKIYMEMKKHKQIFNKTSEALKALGYSHL
ncbi:MAG: SulP family inorganic anion transporter [Niabella sp.]|nr:MAG: SulP family inorganic anion transporter [Niabella sp.]